MKSCETILARIREEGTAAEAALKAESEQKTAAILSQADETAQQKKAELAAETDARVRRLQNNAQSACELAKRNAALRCRREEIDKTVACLLDTLCALPDGEYFDLLVTLARPFAPKNGVLFLNARDLARVPSDFAARLAAVGVTVTLSDTPREMAGGFVLQCGDIEYSADFTALMEEKRDGIEDLIHRELFR